MGKLLASQIHEESLENNETVRIRALVRSEEEALSVRCDLAGMVTVGGVGRPRDADWLQVRVIADGNEDVAAQMEQAFEGATAAVLCDAAHNELVRQNDEGGRWSLRVPARDQADLSERLLGEVRAAQKSSTLQHLVLRSSMGLSLWKRLSPEERDEDDDEDENDDSVDTTVAEACVQVMGGPQALVGLARAEAALSSSSSSIDTTVLRLGALTDHPGPMPLVFGRGDDAILLGRVEGDTDARRPPMISRADAARVAATLVRRRRPVERGTAVVVDCAWVANMGRSSVGSEEALRAANRQDIARDVLDSCGVVV